MRGIGGWVPVASLLAAAAGLVGAAAPADIVATRVAALRELGAAFKNVNDELKSGTPQLYIIQLSARQIRDAAKAQYSWFPAGSGAQPGVKTAAKPEIWAQSAKFTAAQDAFAAEADTFRHVAMAGDVAAITAEAKVLGRTCASCHHVFRAADRE
jgi:cytochrome c556